jgi:PilZ domain
LKVETMPLAISPARLERLRSLIPDAAQSPPPLRRTRLLRFTPEQRSHPRVKLVIDGRFMLEDRTEYPCTTVQASVRSLVIRSDMRGKVGERIICYFDAIGRIEGAIERHSLEGFVLEIESTSRKRDKLGTQLTWLANRDVLNLPEDRRHERIIPLDTKISIRRISDPQAMPIPGQMIDLSRSGAAVAAGGSFVKGEVLLLGTTPAVVTRIYNEGIAVEFRVPIPDAMFNSSLKL